MGNIVKIIILGNHYLINTGLEFLIRENRNFELVNKTTNTEELLRIIPTAKADVLMLDLATIEYSAELINSIRQADPYIQILAFNNYMPKHFILKVLGNGVTSYLMHCCDKDEITQAIQKTTQGERFLCGHIVEELLRNNLQIPANESSSSYCGGMTLSEREMEIIRLIAEGNSNQDIADKLFLSVHTVNTHRKNIMNKLGLCNTAGLVMYAVREKIVMVN